MSDELFIIANAPAGSKAPNPALKSNGDTYTYRMYFKDMSQIAYADDPVQLCVALLPGYAQASSGDRIKKRISASIALQQNLRSKLLVSITHDHTIEELDEWEVAVLQGEDRAPHGWSQETDGIDIWHADVPLVLLDVDYKPYTDVTPPISAAGDVQNPPNIFWLRNHDELSFLESLDRLKLIHLSKDKYFGQ